MGQFAIKNILDKYLEQYADKTDSPKMGHDILTGTSH